MAESRLINLYVSNICNVAFQKLFVVEMADIHFIIKAEGNLRIPAHKTLLSSISPVFAAMFNGNWKESSEVNITGVSAAAFNGFLQFFYNNEVILEEEYIHEILKLADKYCVEEIIDICSTFLIDQLSVTNVLYSVEKALIYNVAKLSEECNKFISENTERIFKSQEFLECDLDMLRNILKLSSFSCKEEIVFDACIEWALNACTMNKIDHSNVENLRTQLGDCFNLIRFNEMDENEFVARYESKKDMFSRSESDEVLLTLLSKKNVEKRYQERLPPLAYFCEFENVSRQKFKNDYSSSSFFRVTGVLLLKAINISDVFRQTNNEKHTDAAMKINVKRYHDTTIVGVNIYEGSVFDVLTNLIDGKNSVNFQIPLLIEPNYYYKIEIKCDLLGGAIMQLYKFTSKNIPTNIKFEVYQRKYSFGEYYFKNMFHCNETTIISSLVFDRP